MANVAFTVTVDNALGKVIFADNSTNWSGVSGNPTSLTIYLKGVDKTTYVVKKVITSSVTINAFTGGNIEYTFEELFGINPPLDDFYLAEIIANEGLVSQMLSNKVAIVFTFQIGELVYRSTLGVHVPETDLLTSLRVGSMPQILEYLQQLGVDTEYAVDRENKWRKTYNHLNTIVNDLDY